MKKRWQAFVYAGRGLVVMLRTQPHARFHLAATIAAFAVAAFLGLTPLEWAVLVVAAALVWTAEALNTALEFLADEVSEEWRDRIGRAKDVAAAAVLLSAIGAGTAGALVLGPHLWARMAAG